MIQEIEFHHVLGALRRRIALILAWVIICVGGAVILLFVLRPVYSATALVLVDPVGKNILNPDTQPAGAQSDSARVDSEVELARSDVNLLQVIEDLRLVSDDEFGARLGWGQQALTLAGWGRADVPSGRTAVGEVLERLRRAITVRRRDFTFLIAISARSKRQDFAAELANRIAEIYVAGQLRSKVAAIQKAQEVVATRLRQAGGVLAESERAFDRYIDERLLEISRETARPDLLQLQRQIEAAANERSVASSAIDAMQRALASRDWANIGVEWQDAAIGALRGQYLGVRDRLASGAEPLEGGNTELDRIETDLVAAVSSLLERTQLQSDNAQAQASELRRQLRAELLAADLPAQILTDLYRLRQTAEISRQQYQTLLARQAELETQTHLQVADSRLASPAIPATRPGFPDIQLFLLGGLALGLVLGSGAALVTENFVGGFTDARQVEAILGIPVAAELPHDRFRTSRTRSVADNMLQRPLSPYAESIRRLRVAVDRTLRDDSAEEGARVIVITSAEAAEGKSSVALALTRSIALNEKSALLIDCDLRRPSLHRYIGSVATAGLLDYLSGDRRVPFDSILTRDEESGAQVIIGMDPSDLPTDKYVTSRTFQRLIDAAKRSFDYVILDTTPIGHAVDGVELAAISDMVLLVVKWGATPQATTRAATLELSTTLDSIPMRAVLNETRTQRRASREIYGSYD